MKKIIIFLSLFILCLVSCSSNNLDHANNNSDDIIDDTKEDDVNAGEEESKPTLEENAIFASINGDGNGSIDSPYSLETGLNSLTQDNTLYLRGGVYNLTKPIRLSYNGNQNKYYNIFAYPGENVTFDYGKYNVDGAIINEDYLKQESKGIIINGTYIHLKGIRILASGSIGMQIYGHHNWIENCIFERNGNVGLAILGSASSTFDQWPSFNLIQNCTSFGNFDWNRSSKVGEDADGFSASIYCGEGNVFDSCISYNNSDDGFDLFTKQASGKIGSVVLKNCIAFSNGYSLDGTPLEDGNGFKLGGRAIEVDHTITNCLAFSNKNDGFCDNTNPGTLSFTNCTSFSNGVKNFNCGFYKEDVNTYNSVWKENGIEYGPIENVPKSHNVFVNCFSYDTGKIDDYVGKATNTCFSDKLATNTFYTFSEEKYCSSKDSRGKAIVLLEAPFIDCDIAKLDLTNIHTNFRSDNGDIHLDNFSKINDSFLTSLGFSLGIGANLQ